MTKDEQIKNLVKKEILTNGSDITEPALERLISDVLQSLHKQGRDTSDHNLVAAIVETILDLLTRRVTP